MHKVFVIGNGFDLSLGLRTSYKDFISSTFFARNLNVGCNLFEHLNKIQEEANWIDIEKELERYSQTATDYNSFLNEYKKLCEELKSYIKFIDMDRIDKNSKAYQFLSNQDLGDRFTILNFNYTDSVAYILTNNGYSVEDIRNNIIHVHGSAKVDNIIFGVDDSSRINKEHTFLYKSTSSIYNGRSCIGALDSFDSLYIFGHSLGKSDHMYFDFFQKLISRSYDKKITVFHYGEEGKYSIYKELHELTYSKVSKLKNNVSFIEEDTSS